MFDMKVTPNIIIDRQRDKLFVNIDFFDGGIIILANLDSIITQNICTENTLTNGHDRHTVKVVDFLHFHSIQSLTDFQFLLVVFLLRVVIIFFVLVNSVDFMQKPVDTQG
jgi:hypothetical protein